MKASEARLQALNAQSRNNTKIMAEIRTGIDLAVMAGKLQLVFEAYLPSEVKALLELDGYDVSGGKVDSGWLFTISW